MEVKGLERWGADWRNVVDRRAAEVERHPRADRLSLTTRARRAARSLEIVCGATNIARRPAGPGGPARAPSCPATAPSSGPRRWASSATGCSAPGDELRLTGDGERDPDPAGRTRPLGVPLADLYGDVGARRGRQAEPRRRPVPGRPRPRGRRRPPGRRSRFPAIDLREDGRADDRGSPGGRRGRPRAVSAVRRALGARRRVGAVARTTSRCGSWRPGCARSATSSTPRTT